MKTIKTLIFILMTLDVLAQVPKEQFSWSIKRLESFTPFAQSISYNSTVYFLNIQKNGFFKIQNDYDIVSGIGLYNSTDSIDIMGIRYGKSTDTLYVQSVKNRGISYYFNLNKSFLTDSLVKKNLSFSQTAYILPLGTIVKIQGTEIFWGAKSFNSGYDILKVILKKDKYYLLTKHSVIEMVDPIVPKKVFLQKTDLVLSAFDIASDGKYLISYEKDKKYYISLYNDTELAFNQEVIEQVKDIAFVRDGEFFVSFKNSVSIFKFLGEKEVVFSESFFPENQPVNTFMGRISVVRSDPSLKYSFILLDSPNFNLKGDSLFSNKVFDFESQKAYQLRIIAKSDKDIFETKLNLFISDVFEQIKPVFVTNDLGNAKQNSDYNVVIKASDGNGDKLVFSSKYLPSWMKLTDKADGSATLQGKPASAGLDSVIITVSDGIDRVDKKYYLTILESSGIWDNNLNFKCLITNGFIKIESQSKGNLEMINLLGQKELEANFSQKTDIPFPSKIKGIYLIKIKIEKKTIFRKVFIR